MPTFLKKASNLLSTTFGRGDILFFFFLLLGVAVGFGQDAPSGYSVTIDQDQIGANNETAVSFTFAGAELDANYNYTFSSDAGGTDVIGSGTIVTATDQIAGIDLSGLNNGIITLSVTLTNANGEGIPVADSVLKETCYIGTTTPTLDGSVPTIFCDDFNQNLNDYIIDAPPDNSDIRWSTSTDLLDSSAFLASNVVSDPGTYYGFFNDPFNDCTSDYVTVILTQNFTPTTGIASNLGACSNSGDGDALVDLDESLTGQDAGNWVLSTSPGGSSITINANNTVNFDGQPEGNYIFTFTTTGATGTCANQSVDVTITVNDCSAPCNAGNTAPQFNGDDTTIEFCDIVNTDLNSYVTGASPAGTTLIWSTSNDPTETGAHLISSTVVDPGTYYGFFYDEVNDCGSPVLPLTLVENETPELLSVSTDADLLCGPSAQTLSASATVSDESTISYTWYDAPTGGNIVGVSETYTSNILFETTSFYVTASANGCESDRVEVIATINEQLSPGIPIDGLTVCNITSDDGPNIFDLDDGLMGQDTGTWNVITDPSNGDLTIGTDNIVDFTGLISGEYTFEYTTDTVGDCTETSSVQLTITVQDCISNEAIDLAITKVLEVDRSYLVGDEITFVISLENIGENLVTDIVVLDILEDGFEYLDHNSSIGDYNPETGEWTIDQMTGADLEAILSITVRVIDTRNTQNTATLLSSIPADDEITENNSDTVTVTVNRSQCLYPGTICNIFSPNGDGYNDTLKFVGHELFPQNSFEVFDRYGNSVFQMDGYNSSWDGTGKNGDLPKGTYFYILDLNGDGTDVVKGWIQIVRNN